MRPDFEKRRNSHYYSHPWSGGMHSQPRLTQEQIDDRDARSALLTPEKIRMGEPPRAFTKPEPPPVRFNETLGIQVVTRRQPITVNLFGSVDWYADVSLPRISILEAV